MSQEGSKFTARPQSANRTRNSPTIAEREQKAVQTLRAMENLKVTETTPKQDIVDTEQHRMKRQLEEAKRAEELAKKKFDDQVQSRKQHLLEQR